MSRLWNQAQTRIALWKIYYSYLINPDFCFNFHISQGLHREYGPDRQRSNQAKIRFCTTSRARSPVCLRLVYEYDFILVPKKKKMIIELELDRIVETVYVNRK